MSAACPLSPDEHDELVPMIDSAFETAQKNLEGLIQHSLRFGTTSGHLTDVYDDDVLRRPRHAHVVYKVNGGADGRIVFLCPLPLAATLAGWMLMMDEGSLDERRKAGELTSDEWDAFRETATVLGSGLDAALRARSSLKLNVQLENAGASPDLNADDLLDDSDLVHFVTECTLSGFPVEEVHVVAGRTLIRKITGTDVGGAADDDDFGVLSSDGRGFVSIVAAGVGASEQQIVLGACDAQSVEVQFADDVRDLLYAIVNHDCVGAIVGDKLSTANARTADVNLASLKRVRSHAKGRTLPIVYLMEWPERDVILQMAQLGVRDIIALPAKSQLLEKRIERFVRATQKRRQGA